MQIKRGLLHGYLNSSLRDNNSKFSRQTMVAKSLTIDNTFTQLKQGLDEFKAQRSSSNLTSGGAHKIPSRINYNTLLLKSYDQFRLKKERRELDQMRQKACQSAKRISCELSITENPRVDLAKKLILNRLTEYCESRIKIKQEPRLIESLN